MFKRRWFTNLKEVGEELKHLAIGKKLGVKCLPKKQK